MGNKTSALVNDINSELYYLATFNNTHTVRGFKSSCEHKLSSIQKIDKMKDEVIIELLKSLHQEHMDSDISFVEWLKENKPVIYNEIKYLFDDYEGFHRNK